MGMLKKLFNKKEKKALQNTSKHSVKTFRYITIFRKVSINTRLLFSFIFILVSALLFTGIIAYYKSSSAIQSKISMYSSQIIGRIGVNIENVTSMVKADSESIVFNQKFQDNVLNYDSVDAYDQLTKNNNIKNMFSGKSMSGNLYKSLEFDTLQNERVSSNTVLGDEDVKAINDTVQKESGQIIWTYGISSTGAYNIIYARQVKSLTSSESLGTYVAAIDEAGINNIFSATNIGKDSDLFIINSKGVVISGKDKKYLGKQFKDKNLISSIIKSENKNTDIDESLKQDHRSFSIKVNNVKCLVTYAPIASTDWYIVGTIPYSYINSGTNLLKISSILVGIIALIISLALAYVITKSITAPLNKLKISMSEAKEGNLAVDVQDESKDEIGKVMSGFSDMVGKINTLISEIKDLSQNVTDSSEKIIDVSEESYNVSDSIAVTMQEIAKGTSEQATEVTESVSHMNTLSNGINIVGNNMKNISEELIGIKKLHEEAVNSIKILNDRAEETNAASNIIVEDINNLSSNMKEIKDIVDIMVSIAEQTNLLSLNAAIEAARAGESGRGFAVVAEEVRKLADTSKDASIKISSIINEIEAKTQNAVHEADYTGSIVNEEMGAVNKTEEAFTTIFGAIENISDKINHMETSVSQILMSKDKTSRSMENISAVCEETAATTEEVCASVDEQIGGVNTIKNLTEQLNELTQKLNYAISAFKVE